MEGWNDSWERFLGRCLSTHSMMVVYCLLFLLR